MNDLLKEFLRKFTVVFFDDILTYSGTLIDHLLHLDQVLSRLMSHSFYLRLSKYIFARKEHGYLHHIISIHGV